jgi:hypothetical protein
MTLTLKVNLLNFHRFLLLFDCNLVINKWIIFILWQYNILDKTSSRLNWPWSLNDLDSQGQSIEFCFSCHNFMYYYFQCRQNNSCDQIDMWNNLDMTLTFKWLWPSNDWFFYYIFLTFLYKNSYLDKTTSVKITTY